MAASNSGVRNYEDGEKALKGLLDAFGSAFSLEEIASAYCKASRNADLAGEFLHNMQGSTSNSNDDTSNGEEFSETKSCHTNGNPRVSKQKLRPVSGGTISSVIGKDYARSTTVTNGNGMTTKPLKLDLKEFPKSELWREKPNLNFSKDPLHEDMETYLFQMLGNGFQLDRDVVGEVLGYCGYDMHKSMQKLLEMSEARLNRRNNSNSESTREFTGVCSQSEVFSCQNNFQCKKYSESNGEMSSNTNGLRSLGQEKEKEILAALFSPPDRFQEELPIRTARTVKRPRAFGEVVLEPPTESVPEHKTDVTISYSQIPIKDDEEDSNYQILRKAMKEYGLTMQEYYKSAMEALAAGENVRASKLLEQGQFFHTKAREADDKSNEKIFETRNVDKQTDMVLDLHECGAKEAIRQLKSHLRLVSGIPTFQYLKVIIDTNDEDVSKGARKRLVMKLLEKEAIKWTAGDDDGTILIHLDQINPKNLSFGKK